jgi:hypothetical protein
MAIRPNHTEWSAQEKATLKEAFKVSTTEEIVNLFPARSQRSIENMASRLGLRKDKELRKSTAKKASLAAEAATSWESHEDAVVRAFYPTPKPVEEIALMLRIRSARSVVRRAHELGVLRNKRLSSKELAERIRADFPSKGASMAAEIGYSAQRIRKLAKKLGVVHEAPARPVVTKSTQNSPHLKAMPAAQKAIGKAKPTTPKKEDLVPWWREPHNSDEYKQGLAAHLAGKKKTLFIDANGRQAVAYKTAA